MTRIGLTIIATLLLHTLLMLGGVSAMAAARHADLMPGGMHGAMTMDSSHTAFHGHPALENHAADHVGRCFHGQAVTLPSTTASLTPPVAAVLLARDTDAIGRAPTPQDAGQPPPVAARLALLQVYRI